MQASADAIPDIAEATSKWYLQNRNDLMKCRRLYVIGYDNCLADMMEGTLKICEAVRYSVQGFELEEFMHGIYHCIDAVSYTHLRAHETDSYLVCRLLLEKKKPAQ